MIPDSEREGSEQGFSFFGMEGNSEIEPRNFKLNTD
jgi:hypothetical protein